MLSLEVIPQNRQAAGLKSLLEHVGESAVSINLLTPTHAKRDLAILMKFCWQMKCQENI